MWFMGMMHRLFGVPEFADALELYDEEMPAHPERAPVLRVLRRLIDANNPLQPDDWDHVLIHTDRILARRSIAIDWAFPSTSRKRSRREVSGGYHATHVLLAWIWMQDNRCQLAVRDGFVEDMYRANAAILEDQPTIVNDLKLEAAAFLCMARQGKRVDPVSSGTSSRSRERTAAGGGRPKSGQPGRVVLALHDPGAVAAAARRISVAPSDVGRGSKAAGRSPPPVHDSRDQNSMFMLTKYRRPSGSYVASSSPRHLRRVLAGRTRTAARFGSASMHGGSSSSRFSMPTLRLYLSANR